METEMKGNHIKINISALSCRKTFPHFLILSQHGKHKVKNKKNYQ